MNSNPETPTGTEALAAFAPVTAGPVTEADAEAARVTVPAPASVPATDNLKKNKKKKKNNNNGKNEVHNYKWNFPHCKEVIVTYNFQDKSIKSKSYKEIGLVLEKLNNRVHDVQNITDPDDLFVAIQASWQATYLQALFQRCEKARVFHGVSETPFSMETAHNWHLLYLLQGYTRSSTTALSEKFGSAAVHKHSADVALEKIKHYNSVTDAFKFVKLDAELRAFVKCMDLSTCPDQVPYRADIGQLKLEKTVNDVCKIGYIPGITKCSCDDKKTPCQSMQKLAREKGLAIVMFRSRAGYVRDGIVSVQTGLYLGGRYRYVDETERDSYMQLYLNLPERDGSLVHVALVKLDTTLVIDRGMMKDHIRDVILQMGGHVLGTKCDIRTQMAFNVVDVKNRDDDEPKINADGKLEVVREGGKANYYAISDITVKDKKCRIFQMCVRNGKTIFYCETTDPVWGEPFRWNYYYDPSVASKYSPGGKTVYKIDMDIEIDEATQRKKNEFLKGITELTYEQCTPEWFVCRRFALTSSITLKIVTDMLSKNFPSMKRYVESCIDEDQRPAFWRDIKAMRLIINGVCDSETTPARLEPDAHSEYILVQLSKLPVKDLKTLCEKAGVIYKKTRRAAAEALIQSSNFSLSDVPDEHISDPIIKDLMDAWYNKFKKKITSKQTATDVGSANEESVIGWLPSFIKEHSTNTCVVEVSTFGLIRPRHLSNLNDPNMTICTSVDGLVGLYNMDLNEASFSILEIKTRSSAQEIARIRRVRDVEGSFLNIYVHGGRPTDTFRRVVPNKGYRAQLLHHSYVCQLPRVLFIESTSSGIVFIAHVEFDQECWRLYEKCIVRPLLDKYVNPFISDIQSDPSMLSKAKYNVHHAECTDYRQLSQDFFLRKALLSDADKAPLYPATLLKPRMIDIYNKYKWGIDMTDFKLALQKAWNAKTEIFHNQNITSVGVLHLNGTRHYAYEMYKRKVPMATWPTKFATLKKFRQTINDVCPNRTSLGKLILNYEAFKEACRRVLDRHNGYRSTRTDSQLETETGDRNNGQTFTNAGRKSAETEFAYVRFNERIIHNAIQDKTDKSQHRCLLCCELCEQGKPHKYRKGAKTKSFCFSCGNSKSKNCSQKRVYLCQRIRENLNTNCAENMEARTCFDLWHEEKVLPPTSCELTRRNEERNRAEQVQAAATAAVSKKRKKKQADERRKSLRAK